MYDFATVPASIWRRRTTKQTHFQNYHVIRLAFKEPPIHSLIDIAKDA